MSSEPVAARRRPILRRVVQVTAVVAVLAVAYVGVTFVQVWRAAGHDGARPAEAIVVLGAAQYDGRPSPVLAARLDHAVALYERDIAPLIVVTGGRRDGDRFTEAQVAATYLEEHGIPGGDIERETTGVNSWESLSSAARFLEARGVRDVVLVSDPYHAERIEGIADDLGLDASVSPADTANPFGSLVRETGAVAVGRLIGWDRMVRLGARVEG